MEFGFTKLVLFPIGLGLLGFIEPCSIGSTLIFVKHLEGRDATSKLAQVGAFAGTRAVFIGLLGMLAVVLGTAFLGFQRSAWFVLGTVYVLLGALYVRRAPRGAATPNALAYAVEIPMEILTVTPPNANKNSP